MAPADLAGVMAVAAVVHPDFPEDASVFAERLALWPDGCLVLCKADRVTGYLLSHPWHIGDVPALNSLLGAIPAQARSWYLHDLALLPEVRGSGAASSGVRELVRLAQLHGSVEMALVAVNDSVAFWRRLGFREMHDASLARKLATYDNDARLMQRELKP